MTKERLTKRVLTMVLTVAAATGIGLATGEAAFAATPTCNSVGDAWTGASGPIKIPAYNQSNLSCNLVKGTSGVAVKNLQTELNKCFADKIGAQLVVDGVFGTATFNALMKAQTAAGTASDGEYGPNTRHAFAETRGWWSGAYCLWVNA